ncbi:MAG: DUF4129 domain-containing protein [Chloroflexi bacterium]|nr:DUF4129 domain-containing protein [Chloroflexota bacterium]
MKRENRVLVFLLSTGMELCYLYAAATFLTTAIFHQAFPFPEAVGSFLLAALLTLFSEGRGWRVIFVVAVQSIGFVPALFRMVQVFNSWSSSFLVQTWFTRALPSPSDAIGYFIILLVIGWALSFWAGGVGLARMPKDYFTLCSRFDRGLIAFFGLFLVKLYLQVAQGIRVDAPASGFLIFPFLIFSLLAIGLVRNRSEDHRDFLPGYQKLGVVLSFIVVIVLASIGLAFFFLPYLMLAAQRGSDLLGVVSAPLLSIVYAITGWLFGTDFGASNQQPVPREQLQETAPQWSFPWWVELLGKILAWGMGIVLVLVVLAIAAGLLYGIFQWLFSKTELDQERPSLRQSFVSFMIGLREWIVSFWRGWVRSLRGYQRAVHLYTALRTWGRNSGVPNLPSETPAEYGERLENGFPGLAGEIELIIQAFNREVYGEITLNEEQMATARSAWSRLASPLRWPMRVRAWFRRTAREIPSQKAV